MSALRVLLVSDHKLLRRGLTSLLGGSGFLTIVDEAGSGEEALDHVRLSPPEVILLHARHPLGKSMSALHLLRGQAPDIPIVLLFDEPDHEIPAIAIQAGARGYLDKKADTHDLFRALRDAASGDFALPEALAGGPARLLAVNSGRVDRSPYPNDLTRREIQVLALLSRGLTNREIADSLFVSESTIRARLRSATQKLGVYNRVHAVARAVELGLVSGAGS